MTGDTKTAAIPLITRTARAMPAVEAISNTCIRSCPMSFRPRNTTRPINTSNTHCHHSIKRSSPTRTKDAADVSRVKKNELSRNVLFNCARLSAPRRRRSSPKYVPVPKDVVLHGVRALLKSLIHYLFRSTSTRRMKSINRSSPRETAIRIPLAPATRQHRATIIL